MDAVEEKAEVDILSQSTEAKSGGGGGGSSSGGDVRGSALRDGEHPTSAKCSDYPRSVFFILLNELCERFSYYGMRAVLILFLKDFLHMESGRAVSVYHAFIVGCYLSPLLGGWISDTYLGRFKTILILSVVYICGSVCMTVGSIPSLYPDPNMRAPIAALLGMLLIALGTGGIKPCVSAFGGDQLTTAAQLTGFFTVFYLCINTGSLVSMIVTPQLRDSLPADIAFVVAFGLPAGLLTVATVVLWLGRHRYRRLPPTGSVLARTVRILWTALRGRCTPRCIGPCGGDLPHWLDRAVPAHGREAVAEVRQLLRVLKVFLPLPVFWALFDQQGSRWTLQALQMNRAVGGWEVPAAAVQAVNPALILLLAPLFERLLYPLAARCVAVTPLRRIAAGMLLSALAFVACALLQLAIDGAPPRAVHVLWQVPQYVLVTAAEVLTSITGLEFAYAEAPATLKSVVMAFFLLTVAAGNILVMLSGEFDVCGETCNYFLFAALMVLAFLWFAWMAYRYAREKDALAAAATADPEAGAAPAAVAEPSAAEPSAASQVALMSERERDAAVRDIGRA